MKQAILITVYKNISAVREIIEYFDDSFNFYIHIDKKSEIDYSILKNFQNVSVYRNYVVNWGGYNHVKAILFLCEQASKHDNTIFHLITGEDFPTRSLKDFKKLDSTKNYISSNLISKADEDWMGRLSTYSYYDLFNAKRQKQANMIYRILSLQIKLRIKRPFPVIFNNLKIYLGSTYWSLNKTALEYVLRYVSSNKEFANRFKYTFCPEEFFFQTILLNSPLVGTIVDDNLRYIDWKSGRGGCPAYLDETDFTNIVSSGCFFARKLNDSTSNKLKNKLIAYNHSSN